MEMVLRTEGIPALDLWELIVDVFSDGKPKTKDLKKGRHNRKDRIKPAQNGNRTTGGDYVKEILMGVDKVPNTMPPLSHSSELWIMEDSDATIKMCLKGRSPALRHVPRVFRVDLDTMFERILTDPSIKMQYINTKEQLADILTKGSFTAQTW